ncbi:MAG TPA: NAD/NADP octopine/nopaline dehydrogenase family protein [Candidatus Salinicoccus stercoripullorum]|uniref:NAD/NADP octopine/nopaline dehydrogenase family protein n=1 Tax=Candidatus Salinicoccus stercoripullorum TaxID=2838756 RepID=A0A9D1QEA9_9STAP|nr:NAD/NADP octopine/nopaline dehydrogenase family protein [Candidatus Salinicoccus stercoripullorum]
MWKVHYTRSERSTYFATGENLREQYDESIVLKDLLGPTTFNNRYIIEDVGYGLVLWKSTGELPGIETPAIVLSSIWHQSCRSATSRRRG